jgi:hypothetical protein
MALLGQRMRPASLRELRGLAYRVGMADRTARIPHGVPPQTFNSFWPATGRRSPVLDGGRSITLQQLSEQVKDSLLHVRPDGQVKLTAASWGRETIGDAVVGTVHDTDPADLLATAARVYREGGVGQLPP